MILLDSVEQEHFRNAMNTIPISIRNLARKSYKKSRESGQTHAAAMTTMRNMFAEGIDEKTLTNNELNKREEVLKSLKDKQLDFIKRYGRERAKSVMYATATNIAKATTEEVVDENLHQSSVEGPIAKNTNKNLGQVKKQMGNKTIVAAYLKDIVKTYKG